MTLEELEARYKEILASQNVSNEDARILGYFEMYFELERDRDKRKDMQS